VGGEKVLREMERKIFVPGEGIPPARAGSEGHEHVCPRPDAKFDRTDMGGVPIVGRRDGISQGSEGRGKVIGKRDEEPREKEADFPQKGE